MFVLMHPPTIGNICFLSSGKPQIKIKTQTLKKEKQNKNPEDSYVRMVTKNTKVSNIALGLLKAKILDLALCFLCSLCLESVLSALDTSNICMLKRQEKPPQNSFVAENDIYELWQELYS